MAITKTTWLLWLMLLAPSTALSSEIFQWTDSRGVIHFTDDPSSVPKSIRQSSGLVVRHDFDLRKDPISAPANSGPESSVPASQKSQTDASIPAATEPYVVMMDPPQNITIVVINSNIRQLKRDPCPFREGCKPVFRPDFNDRQYIHPSVFNGRSRQHIHSR